MPMGQEKQGSAQDHLKACSCVKMRSREVGGGLFYPPPRARGPRHPTHAARETTYEKQSEAARGEPARVRGMSSRYRLSDDLLPENR
jgi:hypothetical protein